MCKDLAQWNDFVARIKGIADSSLLLNVEEREQSLITHNVYAEGCTVYIRMLPNDDVIKTPLYSLGEKIWVCAESEFNLRGENNV
jgi:hypothetical protein